MKKRLFLVCPDAHLEPIIPGHFSGEAFFLTALGVAFNPMEARYDLIIDHFIEDNDVEEICLVADTYSRFFRSVVQQKKGFGTYAEQVLEQLLTAHSMEFERTKGAWEKCLLLARLHLARQLQQLEQSRYLGRRIEQGKLKIKAYLYFCNTNRMEEIQQTLPSYAPFSRISQGAEVLYGQVAEAAHAFNAPHSAQTNTRFTPLPRPVQRPVAVDLQTSSDVRHASRGLSLKLLEKIRPYLIPGLVLGALMATVALSVANGSLFLKELLISGSIILMLLTIRQTKPNRS